MFRKENINPKGRKTGDCVVRAIAKAEAKSWIEIYDILVEMGRQLCSLPNNRDVYQEYLKKYEKVDVFHLVNGKKKRYTAKDVCQWDGAYIVGLANHLTVIEGNCIVDTWDCGRKSAYTIWKVRG